MNTVTYSDARNNLKKICDQAQASHDITRIVRKNGAVERITGDINGTLPFYHFDVVQFR